MEAQDAATDAPRLVPAGGGSSAACTVWYRNRYLYSKYNPKKAILSAIGRQTFLPGTIVVANSPCLCYGLAELLAAVQEPCLVLAVEADDALLSLAEHCMEALPEASTVRLLSTRNHAAIDALLRNAAATGRYRRAVSVDLSAGTAFAPAAYQRIIHAAQDIVGTFWKNRVTLTRMGRLFSKNLFQNLGRLAHGRQLEDVRQTIGRPILVCGAGESLDATFGSRQICDAARSGRFYILAVDAALPALRARGIPVDAVVGMEAQHAIQKAYIGTKDGGPATLFADLCSLPLIPRALGWHTVWFMSEYADATFLRRLKQDGIIAGFIPPLGSVGLAATYIALAIRIDASVPVCITGLDFSYTAGVTHARGTPAHRAQLSSTDRLHPAPQIAAAFAPGCATVADKNGRPVVTSTVLGIYAQTFSQCFGGEKNIFDVGASGLDLHVPRLTTEALAHTPPATAQHPSARPETHASCRSAEAVRKYYGQEQEALLLIRELLTQGEASPRRNPGSPLEAQLAELILPREYLYLHFPDGYRPAMEQSFLKRVRAELDFFLKHIAIGAARL